MTEEFKKGEFGCALPNREHDGRFPHKTTTRRGIPEDGRLNPPSALQQKLMKHRSVIQIRKYETYDNRITGLKKSKRGKRDH